MMVLKRFWNQSRLGLEQSSEPTPWARPASNAPYAHLGFNMPMSTVFLRLKIRTIEKGLNLLEKALPEAMFAIFPLGIIAARYYSIEFKRSL